MEDFKFDDLDKDMEKMKGESSKRVMNLSSKDPLKEVLGFLGAEEPSDKNSPPHLDPDSYEAVCERLRSHTNKRWICLPVANSRGFKNKFLIKDIYDCSNEEFHAWVNYILASANHKSHRASAYSSMESRERTHDYIVMIHNALKFPSIEQIMPVLKLNDKKKDKKNKKVK